MSNEYEATARRVLHERHIRAKAERDEAICLLETVTMIFDKENNNSDENETLELIRNFINQFPEGEVEPS